MSIPAEGESHLLEAARYSHPNPQATGMDAVDSFPWSSCREHVSSQNLDHVPFCGASLILEMLDDSAGFHQVKGLEIEILDLVPARPIRSDAEATAIASMLKAERNASLEQLHARGASIRHIDRLTRIDRGTIQTAVKEKW